MADEQGTSPIGDHKINGPEALQHSVEETDLAGILEEEIHASATSASSPGNGFAFSNRYHDVVENDSNNASEDGLIDALPRRSGSPIGSLLSVPDDSPSIQGSVISSPGSSVLPSAALRPVLGSPTPSFRPFDLRFQSRIASPSPLSPRPSSPFVFGHSRQVSATTVQLLLDPKETDTPTPPWESVRWTRLTKLNGQAFSETGKRNFGSPTCLVVSASIVLGTSTGLILVFDYNQNLRMIIGPGTKAIEAGPITAIAISADYSTIAGGHASGCIFTWDTTRAARPFLTIPPLDMAQNQRPNMDGHLPNVAVTHLGFLGTRHTALVSADDRGMAFSHLATRGTGALGRTIKTTRILGRYSDSKLPLGKPLKPSTVLGFASLPLGNVEMATDTMGLTAMLTPYLLVIVSTTPVAETQHKSARPKEVAAHSALTGCLAWFPAVKLKVADPDTGSQMSKVKLVYCWSNVLTVLEVDEVPSEAQDSPPALQFQARSRWKCEEPIVAVQWLSRSVLSVLTITQRLIVLEDRTMRMTEAFDLIHKHIYHADLFSRQLHALVEQLDEEDTSMHGVVADAFYMSFKAYKGRLFLLGFNEVSMGALSNWADRLIALMEHGDYVEAIRLATAYYVGDADKLTIGLPEDPSLRHSMVRNKLMEIMGASLKYAFAQRQKRKELANDKHLKELAETCLAACDRVGDLEFPFDEMFEWYEDASVEGIFLEALEPYILDEAVTTLPPAVVKAMAAHYVSRGLAARFEEILCHLETSTLDLDQTTSLCKQHGLFDALLYIWNRALGDYITPFIELLALLVPLMPNGEFSGEGNPLDLELANANASKMFPYLSYILTGRTYPTGDSMPPDVATKAKSELYWFLFSGKSVEWPRGTSKSFVTRPSQAQEPTFPYLRMLLKFDTPSMLSALNEAFEDPFLNESPDKQLNGRTKDLPEEQIFGLMVDRQYVVSILMEVINTSDFAPEDIIYLDMFVARNLAKYPQYLLFPGSALIKTLTGLCHYPAADLADDAQLSAEYLLSVYQPPDMSSLMPLFKEAGFYRVLKRIFRGDKQFGKLLQAYFEDPDDRDATFDCIEECLRPHAGLSRRQVQDVYHVIQQNAGELMELDPARSAQVIASYAPDLHQQVLESADDEPQLQHMYLKTLFEPEHEIDGGRDAGSNTSLVEQYIQLMCKFDPAHVSDYVEVVQSTDLRLSQLLPTMEETGVIDAAVVLMVREGQVQEAMARLLRQLHTLEMALEGLVSSAATLDDETSMQASAEEIAQALRKYVFVGIWLCESQTKSAQEANSSRRRQNSAANGPLASDEHLWLDLVEASVRITQNISSAMHANSPDRAHSLDINRLLELVRLLVQNVFSALLSATSARSSPVQSTPSTASVGNNVAFLRILKAFLSRAAASSPSLADLRAVLASIFSTYAYEESILRLSNRLLERSLFVSVHQALELRQRGWRPKGSTCEACGRRVWGPGVAGNVFEAWEERRAADERRRDERRALRPPALDPPATSGKGKGNEPSSPHINASFEGAGGRELSGTGSKGSRNEDQGDGDLSENRPGEEDAQTSGGITTQEREHEPGPVVVLACRHIYHQRCLENMEERETSSLGDKYSSRAYRCPIDG